MTAMTRLWRRLSVSVRVIGLSVAVLALLLAIPAAISVHNARRTVDREFSAHGEGLAQFVATACRTSAGRGEAAMRAQLESFVRGSPLIDHASVRAVDGSTWLQAGVDQSMLVEDRTFSALVEQEPGGAPAYAIVHMAEDGRAAVAAARVRDAVVGFAAGLVAIALALGLALHRSVGRPLRLLVEQAQRLEQGDLDSEVTLPYDGEYDKLAQSLDSMRQTVRNQLGRFQKLTDDLGMEIVERRGAEEKLRDGKARTDAILEHALDAIVTFDADGSILEFNPAAQDMFQWTRDDALNRTINELVHQSPTRTEYGLDAFLRTQDPSLLGRRLESTLLREGRWAFPAELTISSMRALGGSLYTAYIRDISTRKRDAARARHQLRLREITQGATAHFVVSDDLDDCITVMLADTGSVLKADRAFLVRYRDERKWLYHTHEWAPGGAESGQSCSEPATRVEAWTAELLQGHIIQYDQNTRDALPEALREDVESRGLDALLVLPVFIFGKLEAIIGYEIKRFPRCWLDEEITVLQTIVESFSRAVERRVAERQRVEAEGRLREALAKAQSASKMKTDFLANMSHEIRTPMTAILGYADLLLRSLDRPEDVEEWARSIHSSADHLLALLNDILDLSKIEAGQMSLSLAPCSPVEIIEETHRLLQSRAREKMLDLRVEYCSTMPRRIQSDAVRLRQIVVNLAGNAVKFTDEGSVTLRASSEVVGGRVMMNLDVVDTGIGIDADHLEMIFQPFQQADNDRQRRAGGTGLGLDISRRLAGMLGGDIDVRSTVGKGSTFRLRVDVGAAAEIELAEAADIAAHGGREATPEQTLALGERRFLVVDDNPDNRRIISFLLAEAGADVATAENGQLGVEAALAAAGAGAPYDIILMDIQMPVMDGYTATAALRAAGHLTPIIALTAHAMTGDQQRCLAVGCNEYVSKPIIPRSFFAAIERQLGTSPAPVAGDAATVAPPAEAPPEAVEADGSLTALLSNPAFAPLVEEYVESLGEKIMEIEAAREAGERDTLRVLAHRLKGTAANFGFADVTEKARTCEALIRGDEADESLAPAVGALLESLRAAQREASGSARRAA